MISIGCVPSTDDSSPWCSACLCAKTGLLKVLQLTPDGRELIVRFVGPSEPFGGLLDAFPRVRHNITREMAEHMTDALTRVRELATERVGQRLAHTLLRLMRHCGERAAGGVLIPIPLTRQELADLTGTRALELDTVLLGPCRVAPEPLGAWRTRCRLGDMAARRNPLPASGVGGILVRSPIIRKERPCTVR